MIDRFLTGVYHLNQIGEEGMNLLTFFDSIKLKVFEMARAKIFYDESQIIEKAFEQISKDGYEKFSLRGLARDLKVNPMTLYHYVSNKTDIVKKVILKGLSMLEDSLRKELSRLSVLPDEPAAIYKILARVALDSARVNPKLYALMFNTDLPELVGDENLTEAYKGARKYFWDRIPEEDRELLANEILLFEILMNAMIIRHLKMPENYTTVRYFDMIEISLKRFFTVS
jgi:AcrR family transcriptional regulator